MVSWFEKLDEIVQEKKEERTEKSSQDSQDEGTKDN